MLAQYPQSRSQVVPHINAVIAIETVIERGEGKPPVTMSVEGWQAQMKGCQVLVSLLDRKAKLLGMDAPVKNESHRLWSPKPRRSAPAPAKPSDSGPALPSIRRTFKRTTSRERGTATPRSRGRHDRHIDKALTPTPTAAAEELAGQPAAATPPPLPGAAPATAQPLLAPPARPRPQKTWPISAKPGQR